MSLYLVSLAAPVILGLCSVFALSGPGRRPALTPRVVEAGAFLAIPVAIAAAALVVFEGAGSSPLLGLAGAGLTAKLDVVSVTMLLLVSFVGWIVVRYSVSYLDGEERQ